MQSLKWKDLYHYLGWWVDLCFFNQIEEKVKVLTEKSHKLAEAVYAKEQGQQAGGTEGAKKADDDDVIDAEVE